MDDPSQQPWHAAPEWQAHSVRQGVIAVLTDDVGPEESHRRWLALKEAEGWKYGPEKSAERKEHPCMLPYLDLPFAQRQKDSVFGAMVRAAASQWFEHPRSLRAAPGEAGHALRVTDVTWADWMSDHHFADVG